MTGWWRATYGGSSPWTGTASAGGSGSRDLTTHPTGNPYSAGTVVNALTPAHSDGNVSPHMWMDAPGTVDTYIAPTIFSGWVLANVADLNGDTRTIWQSSTGGPSGDFEVGIGGADGANAGLPYVLIGGFNQAIRTGLVTSGTYALITFRYDGATLQIGVNEVPGAGFPGDGNCSKSFAVTIDVSGTLYTGLWDAFFHLHPYKGDIADMGLTDFWIDDITWCKIICYHRARYALALTAP